MQVRRDDVAHAAKLLPVERGVAFPALQLQLAQNALVQRGDGFAQRLGFLTHPLGAVGLRIKAVEQLREGAAAGFLHEITVLQNLPVRKLCGNAAAQQQYGRKAVHRGKLRRQKRRQRGQGKTGQRRVRRTGETEAQLPRDQRRDAREGAQQPLIQPPSRLGGRQKDGDLRFVRLLRDALVLPGRIAVKQARQDLSLLGHFKVHATQAVEDASLGARQNQVGIAPHQLQNQRLPAGDTHFVRAVEDKRDAALGGRLLNLLQAAAG